MAGIDLNEPMDNVFNVSPSKGAINSVTHYVPLASRPSLRCLFDFEAPLFGPVVMHRPVRSV
jgi:hypothetical protein